MLNRWVLSRDRKTATEGAEVTSSGRLFQTRAAATGKARSPTVRVRLTISDEDELERSRWRATTSATWQSSSISVGLHCDGAIDLCAWVYVAWRFIRKRDIDSAVWSMNWSQLNVLDYAASFCRSSIRWLTTPPTLQIAYILGTSTLVSSSVCLSLCLSRICLVPFHSTFVYYVWQQMLDI